MNLAIEFHKPCGYLIARHTPLRRRRRLGNWSPATFQTQEDAACEISEVEASVLDEINRQGSIGANGGGTIEAAYDHLGWSGSLTTPTPCHFLTIPAVNEGDEDRRIVFDVPEAPKYEPMFEAAEEPRIMTRQVEVRPVDDGFFEEQDGLVFQVNSGGARRYIGKYEELYPDG